MRTILACCVLAGLLGCGQANKGPVAPGWATFNAAGYNFQFEYPSSWRVNLSADHEEIMHGPDVLLGLNSLGQGGFKVKMLEVKAGYFQFGDEVVAMQLPEGAAYMEILHPCTLSADHACGPEMEATDLSSVLPDLKKLEIGKKKLVHWHIGFMKWERYWGIEIYLRAPVDPENVQHIERILKSFRFDAIPVGDELWAIGVARKLLPQEADPDKFPTRGQYGYYSTDTAKEGDDVLVTFTKTSKSDWDGPETKGKGQTWRFRVLPTGKAVPVGADGKVKGPDESVPPQKEPHG